MTDTDVILLEYPDEIAIRNAYRELPREGMIFLSTKSGHLARTVKDLEASGFYGIQINTEDMALLDVEISACKGKQGACYETGRSATYRGAGLAALDDDNHLIVGTMRVCEKTGGLYLRDPYQEFIAVSEADPEMLKTLDLDPVPFDCNTLERDAAELRRQVTEEPVPESERVPLFYCGPFRVLVLDDGTILRRGQATTVPAHLVEALADQGGAHLPDGVQAQEPEFFQTRYDEDGAACLLGDLPLGESFPAQTELRLEALAQADDAMRTRLRQMIARGDKQFVLTGSDPRNPFGCCPDPQVLQANQLVEAGVLSSYRTPTPPDACPTTLFAFRDEIQAKDGRPVVEINEEIRVQVAENLGR